MPSSRTFGATMRPASVLLAWLAALALPARAFSQELRAPDALTLEAAQQLALEAQPLLEAQSATLEARRERAVAARQLPDPELQAAVNELPVNGREAWSPSRDSDTDFMVGLVQEFPRAAKRRLRGERGDLLATQAQSELDELQRRIRRDVGLAFLDAHHAERSAEVVERQVREILLERQSVELRVRSGTASQADLLAIEVDADLLRDRVVQQRQAAARARRQLARWIGMHAERPLAFAHAADPDVQSLESLSASLPHHPSMQMLARAEDAAETEVALARQEYRPDWRLEVGYGYRPEFSEMLTVRAAVDLPVFTRNRQDREAAAARRDLAAASSRREDRLRELTAQIAAAHDEWRLLGERAASFAQRVLPRAQSRVEAATVAYRAGRGTLAEAIAARRALLDVELQALDLTIEREHRRVELEYFAIRGAHL